MSHQIITIIQENPRTKNNSKFSKLIYLLCLAILTTLSFAAWLIVTDYPDIFTGVFTGSIFSLILLTFFIIAGSYIWREHIVIQKWIECHILADPGANNKRVELPAVSIKKAVQIDRIGEWAPPRYDEISDEPLPDYAEIKRQMKVRAENLKFLQYTE